MRRFQSLLLVALLFLASSSLGERVHLKDGSIILGTIEKLTRDTLYLETSYGAKLRIPRGKLLALEFSDSAGVLSRSVFSKPVTAAPGSLLVIFGPGKLSSKIAVHRGKYLRESIRANWIEEAFYVDGEKVFSYIDTTMDKVIRSGPEEIFKNTIELKDIRLELPAGPHRSELVIRNIGAQEYRDRFEKEPLFEKLDLGDVLIYPGRTVRLNVEVKLKRWGFGGKKLDVKR